MLPTKMMKIIGNGVISMKGKGDTKRVSQPRFWGDYEENVSEELKAKIFTEYLSLDTLYTYCDSSANPNVREMSVACSYIQNGSIIVKNQLIYPPQEAIHKNIYGELKAIMFGLSNFQKYMENGCYNVILYSDIKDIKVFLNNKSTFKKNNALKELQSELIKLYKRVKMNNPDLYIRIEYLPVNHKTYNPFAKSCHNAAKRMLKLVSKSR